MSHSPRLKKSVSYFIDLLHRGNKIAPPFFPKSFLFLCLTSKVKREHSKTNKDFPPFNAAGNGFFARFFQKRRIYRLQLTISCTTLLLSKTNTNNNKFYPRLKVELKLLYSTALYFLLTLHRLNISFITIVGPDAFETGVKMVPTNRWSQGLVDCTQIQITRTKRPCCLFQTHRREVINYSVYFNWQLWKTYSI